MKYKLNGQWVDVSIKPLDSMPVGTMVDYTGSDIPTGWVITNDYLQNVEIDTGKRWIDDRKIYRKVIVKSNFALPQGNGAWFAHEISNLSSIVNFNVIFNNNGTIMQNYIFDSDGYKVFSIDTTNINYWGTTYFGGGSGRIWYFIIEYTKSS